MCLRAAAVFLPHFFSLKNEKYCAAVASVSWLTDAAYPLRVHTVFLRFPNFELSQKSRLGLLAKLCGVALILIRKASPEGHGVHMRGGVRAATVPPENRTGPGFRGVDPRACCACWSSPGRSGSPGRGASCTAPSWPCWSWAGTGTECTVRQRGWS